MKTLMLIFLLTMGLSAQASSDNGCLEYSNLVSKIAGALHDRSPESLATELAGVDARDFWEVKQSFYCVPVKKSNRLASSDRKTTSTKLLVPEWNELSYVDKVHEAAHQLCVLAGYENDGQDFLSRTIVQVLAGQLEPYGRNNYGMTYADGSTGFKTPFAEGAFVRGTNSIDADSLCRYFGLGKAIKYEFAPIRNTGRHVDAYGSTLSTFQVGFATTRNGKLISVAKDSEAPEGSDVSTISFLLCESGKSRSQKLRLQ